MCQKEHCSTSTSYFYSSSLPTYLQLARGARASAEDAKAIKLALKVVSSGPPIWSSG